MLPQQSCLRGLYRPLLLHLLGNTEKYSPSCHTNKENQLFQYCPTGKGNTRSIIFINWECLYYDSSQDAQWNIAWAQFPSCSGYILPCIPPLIIIQICICNMFIVFIMVIMSILFITFTMFILFKIFIIFIIF